MKEVTSMVSEMTKIHLKNVISFVKNNKNKFTLMSYFYYFNM